MGYWRIFGHRGGGQILLTNEATPRSLSLPANADSVALELVDPSKQKEVQTWLLSRSGMIRKVRDIRNLLTILGYYIQNRLTGETNHVLTAKVNGNVVIEAYKPFGQSRMEENTRSDAFQIWHLIKDGEIFRLINEFSRTTLSRGGNDSLQTSGYPSPRSDHDSFSLFKNGEDLWFKCNSINANKNWLQRLPPGIFNIFGTLVFLGEAGELPPLIQVMNLC
jgi:hypothetical protein